MRKDHRPYFLKAMEVQFEKWYARHFILPQLDVVGCDNRFIKPWYIKLFGNSIDMGSHVTLIAAPDRNIHLSVWPKESDGGKILIDDYSLVSPGVRISSADEILIGKSCMLASNVYITDANWHGIYNRIAFGQTAGIRLEENVWVGDSAIILKGVTIGKNSIIGAGSVVTRSVPEGVIAAGNPARIIKTLSLEQAMVTRGDFFRDTRKMADQMVLWDQAVLEGNTFFKWLKHCLFPSKKT